MVLDRIIEALVGTTVSVIFAAVKKKYAIQVLALGIAGTALFVASSRITWVLEPPPEERDYGQESGSSGALHPESESATLQGGEFQMETTTVTAYTNDTTHRNEVWRTDEAFAMPSVPDPEKAFKLQSLRCPPSSAPVLALREITTAHPSFDVIYSANVRLEGNSAVIALRGRRRASGYVYIEVSLLCHSGDQPTEEQRE